MKEWHGDTYGFELFEPDASVVGNGVESLASLFGDGSAEALGDGDDGRYRGEAEEVFYG